MHAELSARVAVVFFEAIRSRLPGVNAVAADFNVSRGNTALCLIDPDGRIFGEIYGDDKLEGRVKIRAALTKATQVWITGYPTGTFEELVYARKLDPRTFGLQKPDLIGWEGGHPVDLGAAGKWAAALSGYRGQTDTQLILEATAEVAAMFREPA